MSSRRVASMVALAALALTSMGCPAVLRSTRLRPDYEQVDRYKTKRLAIVTTPAPAGNAKAAELWSRIARDYVNLKRQFIVKAQLGAQDTGGAAYEPKSACGEGLEGVLWLQPKMTARGQGFEAEVTARLIRCTDGEAVWTAEGGGSWPSQDAGLQETVKIYTDELGAEVEAFVVPTYRLLHAILDAMPDPVLDEQDKDEKIEYSRAGQGGETLAAL